MIKEEYKAEIWNNKENTVTATIIFQKDPSKFLTSPEVMKVGSGYDGITTTFLYNGFTLIPALIKAFLKYSDPLCCMVRMITVLGVETYTISIVTKLVMMITIMMKKLEM